MKTILIYDQCDANIKFFVLDGDYRHLNKVYVNQCEENEEKEKELLSLLDEDKSYSFFPEDEMSPETFVIVAGFLP